MIKGKTESERFKQVFCSASKLPQLPVAAVQLINAINKADTPTSTLESIIASDIALTTALLRVANSSALAAEGRVGSIRSAILRIGLDSVKTLALSLAVGGGLKCRGNETEFDLYRFSRHSLFVGTAGRCIFGWLQRTSRPSVKWSEDQLLAAGVVHDLSLFILADVFPQEFNRTRRWAERSKTTFSDAFHRIYDIRLCELSADALEAWRFPDLFSKTIRHLETPALSTPDELDAAGCLHLANRLANEYDYPFESWEMADTPCDAAPQVIPSFGEEEVDFVLSAVKRHVDGLLAIWNKQDTPLEECA